MFHFYHGAFTLPDSDSDKVSDSDNITVHSYGTYIKIGNKIGIGSVSVNRPLKSCAQLSKNVRNNAQITLQRILL